MSFQKKDETRYVSLARLRLSGMRSIDIDKARIVNYGDVDKPLTQVEVEERLTAYARKLEEYNQLLGDADKKSNELDAIESQIKEMHAGVLKAATPKFGVDSNEIELLGGTRKSDRKPIVRKPKDKSSK